MELIKLVAFILVGSSLLPCAIMAWIMAINAIKEEIEYRHYVENSPYLNPGKK